MIRRPVQALVVGAALGTALPVPAAICYEIIDRDGCRDSPRHHFARGPERRRSACARGDAQPRRTARHLRCRYLRADRGRSPTGGRALTTDEIVAGWKSFGKSGFGGTVRRRGGDGFGRRNLRPDVVP